ncbi:hypothetical protein DICPUDRAFT_32147 [Dictyostelium purpureum]|uniref:Tyrosine aminotransferase n=1 Tax=Dictyostelium purpureum TaxID=5786 RepID=F0ZII4_DICPU|nr:uncharacterized protein DICPUDRAFT_32147 [Dictyostelium purpureum]EGC36283.1 hypothetical protein DICPUDRAFT_32147 [Dictyostelium purpureum]|eukprot:XP_003287229.1 hypothetical protein DICPUDRAFT_32147 [Dictyostelium purpureum]
MQQKENTRKWNVEASIAAKNTVNPIRQIVDKMNYKPNPNKPTIPLSIGDPCVYGNLKISDYVDQLLIENIKSGKFNGYPPSTGYEFARAAVAEYVQTETSKLNSKDIIIASGASGAIELAFSAILNPGDNILIPKPGFSLYECTSKSKGFGIKYYNLQSQNNFQVDLEHLKSLIDDKTKAILVNNPSNPCGIVYTKQHLQDILAVAEEYCIPIIADEIYADITFGDNVYYPMASLTETVPVLSIGGIAKRFVVPGWRLGWVAIHDRQNILTNAKIPDAIISLSQLILGSNSLIQSVLPQILDKNNKIVQDFCNDLAKTLETHSKLTIDMLSKAHGLKPVPSSGTMYQMIEIDVNAFEDIADDNEFVGKLLSEQSVFLLQGSVFQIPNFFRVVFCAPVDKLTEAYERIIEFCQIHKKK